MDFVVSFQGSMGEQTNLSTVRKLASGKSDVFHVQGQSVSEEFAVKLFFKDEISFKRYKREKTMICSLNHPNIIKYYPVVEHDNDGDLIITEYVQNGDFFNFVTKGGLNHEVHIRTYFHQLIEGLEYMHSKRIAHLDLKLENLLLGNDFLLKIIDFDQSHSLSEEVINCTGTNSYRCPEVQNKACKDAFAADIYSAGIILYTFKAKKFPFAEVQENGVTKIASYDLFMDDNEKFWKIKTEKCQEKQDFFSEDFKELIRGMLERDPTKRMTIQDIKASTWFNKPILSKESLAIRMKLVCQSSQSSSSSEAVPNTARRSTFDSIVSVLTSPRRKDEDRPGFDVKLWGCGFPRMPGSRKQRKDSDEPESSKLPLKSIKNGGSGSGFWNLLSPRSAAKKPVIKQSIANKIIYTDSPRLTTESSKTKSSGKSLKAWNLDSPRLSTCSDGTPTTVGKKLITGPPKSMWAQQKKEKVEKGQVVAKVNSRHPVKVTLPLE